jgi:purine-binding chemotaxis protein CheW
MSAELIHSPAATPSELSGKYLTFALGRESYAVAVLKIREIIRLVEITAVPQVPEYVKGVINLRGKIIPVIDLRSRFGLSHVGNHERTCIVVVQFQSESGVITSMGLVVDAVQEVVSIPPSEIEQTPNFGTKLETDYIVGMAKIKGAVTTLLDIDRVLLENSFANLSQDNCK